MTAYLHLSRYAKGLAVGKRCSGEVIGYGKRLECLPDRTLISGMEKRQTH